jgi:hypothetical protein
MFLSVVGVGGLAGWRVVVVGGRRVVVGGRRGCCCGRGCRAV